jgi:glycerophosphoryl diester phosphodiesterase
LPVFYDVPALCGHRGCGRGVVDGLAENTLDSFLAAVRAGCTWVEVDARLTADGALVARHDPALEDGRPVAEITAAEAEAAGLLRLDALLDALPAGIGVDLEVKTALEDALRAPDRTTGAHTALLAREAAGRRPVLVTSFDASVLLVSRRLAPNVPVGLLTWTRFPLRKAIPAAVHLGAAVVAPQFLSMDLPEPELRRAVDVAHRAGLQILGWCPPREAADKLVAAGVDCLCVDDVLERAAHG